MLKQQLDTDEQLRELDRALYKLKLWSRIHTVVLLGVICTYWLISLFFMELINAYNQLN